MIFETHKVQSVKQSAMNNCIPFHFFLIDIYQHFVYVSQMIPLPLEPIQHLFLNGKQKF